MRIAIRTDASFEIGTGHVVRCLTLATQLRRRGAEVSFITSSGVGNLDDAIQAQGFLVTTAAAGEYDWMVFDHYGISADAERRARDHARRIMVIDDLADRRHDCDLLLDQNLREDDGSYSGLVPASVPLLLGPRFALLREEFAAARVRARRRQSLRHLLVFFGGSDPTDETSKTLRALARARLTDVRITVIVGASNPRAGQVRALARDVAGCEVIGPTSEMADLMIEADLAIGAGGTTSWERCCVGLPALVVAVAVNQLEIARLLDARGFHRYLGEHSRVSERDVADAILAARINFDDLSLRGERAMALVDGAGAKRVCAAMLGPSPPEAVILRAATAADAAKLLAWRNDEHTRAASHSQEPVSAEQHAAWLVRSLANPRRRLYVAEHDGEPVGTVRADEENGTWTLSWTVAPAARGRGLAKHMVASLAREITAPIRAEVKSGNAASARVAEHAGMRCAEQIDDVRIFVRNFTCEKADS